MAFFAKKRKGRRAEAERERAKAERERAEAARAEAERAKAERAEAERAERAKAAREETRRQAEHEAQSRSEAAEEAQRSIECLFMDNEVAAIRALPSQQLIAAVAQRRAALELPRRWSRGWRGLFTYENAKAIEWGASPEEFIRLVAHQARARTHQY